MWSQCGMTFWGRCWVRIDTAGRDPTAFPSFLLPGVWNADMVAGPSWSLTSIYLGRGQPSWWQSLRMAAERQVISKLPWRAVWGQYELPACRILLHEKERNLPLMCPTVVFHFLLHVSKCSSNKSMSLAIVWPWTSHIPSSGHIPLYMVAVAGIGHWRPGAFAWPWAMSSYIGRSTAGFLWEPAPSHQS